MNASQIYPIKIIQLFPKYFIDEWMNNGKELSFKKGELITRPGKLTDEVYILKKGNVCIFHIHIDGKECVLDFLSSGDCIELLDIFTEKESDVFSKALSNVIVAALPKKRVKEIVENTPRLAMVLLSRFSQKYQEMVEILMQVAYGKVEERLIFLLRKLADPINEDNGWHPIPDSITHKDIAGMVASTRETVTVLINKLTYIGILRQYKDRIWIQLKDKDY
jgi:CRP/FNR family transcriptional regulator